MPPPWNDLVTATIDGDSRREIVAEGTLKAVVCALAKKPVSDLQRIALAFPDRRTPPYRIPGSDVGALALQLEIDERAAAWGTQSPGFSRSS